MKIVDCFTFYNELQLLTYRLAILDDMDPIFARYAPSEDRRILVEKELNKAKADAAIVYMDMMRSEITNYDGFRLDETYQDLKERITDLTIDLSVINSLIEQAAALPPDLLKQIYDVASGQQKPTDKVDGAADEAKPNSEKETKETVTVPVHEQLPPPTTSGRNVLQNT
jgi:hypothetical protein